MSRLSIRLKSGGLIDRGKPLKFTFNGKAYTGYQGDTLASALIANGVILTARSFRYHRPRGIFSAGSEESHAIVCLGEGKRREPNVRATQTLLYQGLSASSQNVWPSLKWDLGAMGGWFSRFLPVGFYYKTFQWPDWKWHEGMVRRLAGVAPAPEGIDPDRYDKQHAHCELLIVGGGPAGLAGALSAARSGMRIILADDQPEPGGSLLWNKEHVDGEDGIKWSRRVSRQLTEMENVTLLSRTTIVAAWDHAYFTAEQTLNDGAVGQTAKRLWKIRADRVILASGAIERPLVFPDNDRPGIMLAGSARHYINRYAVRPGSKAVIYTNNDSAYLTALDLHESGVTVNAIVDLRDDPKGELNQRVRELGIAVYSGHEVCATRGYFRVNQVNIRSNQNKPTGQTEGPWLDCDLLCISGGWSPTLHLLSQAGGKLDYNTKLACFIPCEPQAAIAASIRAAGSANGSFKLSACLAEGHEEGLAAVSTGLPHSDSAPTSALAFEKRAIEKRAIEEQAIAPQWKTPLPYKGRQWVGYLHDVTSGSIEIASREGFVSVEHLKRYTTIGMAIDQGKTANVNALGILGEVTGRTIGEVGTTTFRPPYTPVTVGALAGRETGVRAWPIRRLPLHHWHIDAGAVMEDHSGWSRAAYYPRNGEPEENAIHREVLAARKDVTLFDSSSLGKIEVRGPDAKRFLNRMYINNVETLKIGRVRYGMMLNENGIITDDGVFARLDEDFFLVSTSSAGTAEVVIAFEEWLQTEWPDLDVLVHNATTQWATLTVGGPKSRALISKLLPDVNLSAASFPHMSVLAGEIEDIPYRLMRVSFTGELSFELNIPANLAISAWQKLLEAAKEFDVSPLGMEALDVLRIEKGFLEVGVDTDVTTNPLDVGWTVPISKKAADFIGKRSLSRPHDTRPGRLQLVGLKPQGPQLIPVGSHIVCRDSQQPEGHVTSSCISPTLGYPVAMAMLKSGHARLGEKIVIDVDARHYEAEVVALGFYDPTGERLKT